MNTHRRRFINTFVTVLTVFSLFLNLTLPLGTLIVTRAQEVTAEPPVETPAVPEQTPAPETPVATEVPTADPPVEVTPEVTVIPATEEPTLPPPSPAIPFSDDFQDGNTDGWRLSPSWTLTTDNTNLFLTALEPNQTATVNGLIVADFAFTAQVRVDTAASFAFYAGAESYMVTLETNGTVNLYRGAALIAAGATQPALPEGTPAPWHLLHVQIYAGTLVVTVDSVPQLVYTDPTPLPAGAITLTAATGMGLDNVSIIPLIAPIELPVIPTAVPTEAVTPEATAEATVNPELTPEATVSPELTPEATPPIVEQLVLSADFESENPALVLGESAAIVADGDVNHALALPAGSTLFPANPLHLADFRLEARLNLTSAEGETSGVSIPFRTGEGNGYVLTIDAAQTALYRNDGAGLVLLTSSPTPHALNTWHTLKLNAEAGRLVITVNDGVELDYTDAEPLLAGTIAFVAAGAALLDDIAVYALADGLANATPAPLVLSDLEKSRLSGALPLVLEKLLGGDEADALEIAQMYYLPMDNAQNVQVVIWTTTGVTGADLAPVIETVGGVADYVNADNVEAHVPLAGLLPLVNAPQVQLITPASTAVSTGNALAPIGDTEAEGFDIIGANDWHLAGFKGLNQHIAVIDTDFDGLASGVCSSINPAASNTSHGAQVVRVLCDIVPSATLHLYTATTASALKTQLGAADAYPIILITMDLGVDISPGDGTDTATSSGVYAAIKTAKTNGSLVIVSAGNSYGRYVSFNHSGNSVISIKATRSDIIRVRWNGSVTTKTLTGGGTTPFNATGTTGGYFTIPDNTITACQNNWPAVDDPETAEIEPVIRNYCNLTLTLTGGSGYVQVQVQTTVTVPGEYEAGDPVYTADRTKINSVTGGTNINISSSLGRPADSPDALTVGAACAAPAIGLPLQNTTSRGPIMGPGGTAPALVPPDNRTNYKPDLVGPADIGTNLNNANNNLICDSDDNVGFSGTSAAAAHVAGMAALLRSNPSVIQTVTNAAIINYMQSHTVDIRANTAVDGDGFDSASGAGLTVLGNPAPNYPISVPIDQLQPLADATCTGGIKYVNPNNLDITFGPTGAMDGSTPATAYIHAAQAIANSAANGCVILLPGEYVTPISIVKLSNSGVRLRSYDVVLGQGGSIDNTTPDSVIWSNAGGSNGVYGSDGGIFVAAANFTVDGLRFYSANTQRNLPYTNDPIGIASAGAMGTRITNNIFSGFKGGMNGRPIQVISLPDPNTGDGITSQGTLIQDNIFQDNYADWGSAILVREQSGSSSPIVIQHNTFIDNQNTNASLGQYNSVILITDSTVNIFSNRFTRNQTQAIIRVDNDNVTNVVNVFSNVFSDNTNTGPIVQLAPGRRFRFINNTVANNLKITGDDRYIILRGAQEEITDTIGGQWEIYNNLFYNNSNPAAKMLSPIADLGIAAGQGVKCDSISGGDNSDNGARYNWIVNSGDPTGSGSNGGICWKSITASPDGTPDPNGNRLQLNDTPWFQFIGSEITPNDPYQLVDQTTTNDGIDDGNSGLIPAAWSGVLEILKRARISGSNVDIGAYEFKPIEAIDINRSYTEDQFVNPTTQINNGVELALQASGGYGNYTFEITIPPQFYDTDPTNKCGGQPLWFAPGDTRLSKPHYCPPKNFNTENAPVGLVNQFTYRVKDGSGNWSAPADVTINISKVNDPALTTSLEQSILVAASRTADPTNITFQLRPFVNFTDNFVYSEDNGSSSAPGADYPYTYAYVPGSLLGLSGTNLTILGVTESEISSNINNSILTFNANAGEKGKFEFRYTARDATNPDLTQHTVTVEIVPALPTGGLHDDTSFAFTYSGNWTALYSEGNINNTLHQSKTVSAANPDKADFRFVGTGFALYMQGNAYGNYWKLLVDGQPLNWNGSQTVKHGSATCTTSATTGALSSNNTMIYNRTANAYVVSCTRLRPGQAHTVTVENSMAAAILSIDAIGILTDSAVRLNPGFHEVSEAQLTSLFSGWTTTNERGTSNGIAKVTTSTMPPLRFTFRGTGFAIGTTLEQERLSKKGATYDICVKEAGTNNTPICQSFDNALGASTAPIWNVFRPVYGFNPSANYEVTIENIKVQASSRLVIDSIVVFDRQPTRVLPLGTTEDTERDAVILGGGLEDTWTLDTNNTRVSNSSLTSVISTVTKAGPFISFQISDAADSIAWWRYAGRTDSQYIMICVDRGQLESETPCITKPLWTLVGRVTTTYNPLIINETEFTGGWGTAWGSGNSHTVEIFSLTNQPFNLDRLQVLDTYGVLSPSYYEQTVPNLKYFSDTWVDKDRADVTNSRASGGSAAIIKETGEGVFFRFTGTGFSTLFTLDRYGGPVKICWRPNSQVNEATKVADTLAGTCQTFNNYSASAVYQAARTILGLENNTYAAVILHNGADYKLTGTVYTGNTMYIDAIQTYGNQWNTLAELNTLATRYETSYVNRLTENRFQYVGSAWKSVSGTSARYWSGLNYDQVRAFGAGLVFRTSAAADTVRLYRDIRSGYAPLRICSAPASNPMSQTCSDLFNDGGTAYQSTFNLNLGGSVAHVVSITTLNNGIFNLDAIEILNAAGTPLTAGVYTESDHRLVYNLGTDLTPTDTVKDWRNLTGSTYVNGAAIQSGKVPNATPAIPAASVQFDFQGTGFSLFTLIDAASSNLEADISGAHTYNDVPLTSYNVRTYYGMAHSITGLPYGTYHVVITDKNDTARHKFTVDGVEIYDNHDAARIMAPGIYDDNALNANGSLYLNFVPSGVSWTTTVGSRAAAYLNQSYHNTTRQGATVAFEVADANAVTLYHTGATSTSVQLCYVNKTTSARACLATTTLVGKPSTTFTLPAVEDYYLSLTNLAPGLILNVDAIGVYNTAAGYLLPGIYQENHPQLTGFTGFGATAIAETTATDKLVKSTGTSTTGTLQFSFRGKGFSIILVENSTTSASYNLSIDNGVGTISLTNANLTTTKRPVALTYVGFNPSTTYTVTLTKTDASTKPLLVDRVDIMGSTVTPIAASATGNIENTDARIVYFPYFTFTETAATAASGGSQHLSSMQGAVAYFEVSSRYFDYVRETKSSYGMVSVCSDAVNTPRTACGGATPSAVANNIITAPDTALGYQKPQSVDLGVSSARWVTIKNMDAKPMPLDYIRPTNTTGLLTAGYYEDTFTSSNFTFAGSFTSTPQASASGGTVHTTTAVNDALVFQFNGTGFSTYFTFDTKADEVEICWVSGTTDLAGTKAGTCVKYDNQNTATRYRAARTITGLTQGNYTASVQMLADNNIPAPHPIPLPPTPAITMQIDAVQIYNDTLPTNILTTGTRYETNYTNRATDNRFLYYGSGWRTVSGTAAARYSGQNYDTIANVIGAGITFRTNGADAITLYRGVGSGLPALEVCALRSGNQRDCTKVVNNVGSGSQPVVIRLNDTTAHVISIMTLDAGAFNLDAIELSNSTLPLPAGSYEDSHAGLKFTNGAVVAPEVAWGDIYASSYSGGRARLTSDDAAQLDFSFTGTGFEVGMLNDPYAGEVKVCYGTDPDWNTSGNCYTYNNERASASYTISRSVAGLPSGTYYVRITNDEAAHPNNPPRNIRYLPVRMVVDYVNIFGGLPPAITTSGVYNENAMDSSNNPYLQLLPASRWGTFTGTAARGFSNASYTAVVDASKRLSAAYAGPVATLRLNQPGSAATVILNTGAATSSNTTGLLVCVNQVAETPSNTCTTIADLKTQNQIVLNSSIPNLLALSDADNLTLTFRALTPGYFKIDGFQVIYDQTLTPGIHDSFLATSGGLLNASGTWTAVKSAQAYGGWLTRTQTLNSALTFEFSGTGFSVLTQADRYGADMRLCYKEASNVTAFPAIGATAAGITCQTMTTNTTTGTAAGSWLASNGVWTTNNGTPTVSATDTRINPVTAYQYGFAVHGLTAGDYIAEVRHIDTTAIMSSTTRMDWLQVDAIAIFGATSTSLTTTALYDDTQAGIIYAPTDLWMVTTTNRYGPSRGPWNKTEHTTTKVGALAQLRIQGNALVLYQSAGSRSSRQVHLCLKTPEGEQCSNYSQYVARTTYFTPVAFYGFGSGTHEIVIENWDYNRTMSLDGLQVLP